MVLGRGLLHGQKNSAVSRWCQAMPFMDRPCHETITLRRPTTDVVRSAINIWFSYGE